MTVVTNQVRAFVDWDGDGFFNKGLATDPRNLVTNPLTLLNAVTNNISKPLTVSPHFKATSRGLYEYGSGTALLSETTVYLGFNKGSAGSFAAFFTPTATGNYTLQFYVTNSTSGGLFSATVRNIYNNPSDGVGLTVTPVPFTFTGSPQTLLVTVPFTVTTLTNMQVGVEINWTSGPKTIKPTGAMVVAGTFATEVPFNVGTTLSKYDNIQEYIMGGQWQLGATQPFDGVASEGTATLTLDNTAKTFSYENIASPFYSDNSVLDPSNPAGRYPYTFPIPLATEGPIVSIELQDSTLAWNEVWRGFVDTLSIGTGAGTPTATLTANQGFFKLDQYKVSAALLTSYATTNPTNAYTAEWILAYLLDNFWFSATTPGIAAVNRVSGDNTKYFPVVSRANSQLDIDGLSDNTTFYNYLQSAWKDNVTVLSAIRDLMVVDQGFFFLARNGFATYITRDSIYTNNSFATPDLVWDDLHTNLSSYTMQTTAVNSVDVEFSPIVTQVGLLWSAKTPIIVPPGRKEVVTTIKFQNPEGSTIAVQSINPFNSGVSPSTAVAKNSVGTTLPVQNFFIKTTLRNSDADIIVQNLGTTPIYVWVNLYGTSLITYGTSTVNQTSKVGFSPLGAKYMSINSKLVTTRNQANALGSHILQMQGRRYASFSSVSILARDTTWLDRIVAGTVGKRVQYKEFTNTGAINHRVMIVGESMSWTPGMITVNYTMRPADQYPYLNLDTSFYLHGGVVY